MWKTLFLVLAALLGAAWVIVMAFWRVASFAVHILLVLAIISLILHFVRRGMARG